MAHQADIYAKSGVYDKNLPPYLFYDQGELVPDEELLARQMLDLYGEPGHDLEVLEFGAGTGRMSAALLPYVSHLVVSDKYPAMLEALSQKYPDLETIVSNTRDLTDRLKGRTFDLVSGFWTLSYPIGECLETVEDGAIIPRADFEAGVEEASIMVSSLLVLVRPGGRFMTYFFDSESPEQQAVTKIWEQLAPDPGGRRSFTREIAERALEAAAAERGMTYERVHLTGIAPFKDADAMRDWYRLAHCKSVPTLVDSPAFEEAMDHLVTRHQAEDGSIALPVGVYILSAHGGE